MRLYLAKGSSGQAEIFYKHTSYEERYPSVTLRFEPDICHFVELDETSKSLEGFLPMGLWSRVMAFLLNF